MNRSEGINELAAALAKAQGEIKGAKKDESNPFYKSKYADLASVWEAIRDPLSKNSLAVIQGTIPNLEGHSFQDLGLVSPDGTLCYLVEWKVVQGNSPGFQLWRISEIDKTLEKSKVISGCCIALRETQHGVVLKIFGREDELAVKKSEFS